MYADPAVIDKPDLLMRRGGAYYSEAAIGLVASLPEQCARPHSANVRNAGTFSFLDDDAVIEVTCDVSAEGAAPRPAVRVAPRWPGSSRTSARTSNSPSTRPSTVDSAPRLSCPARPPTHRAAQARRRLTDRLLAANQA